MKTHHKEVPPDHKFPDGSYIYYWRNPNGLVYGQLISAQGKPVRGPFTYRGNTP